MSEVYKVNSIDFTVLTHLVNVMVNVYIALGDRQDCLIQFRCHLDIETGKVSVPLGQAVTVQSF